MIFELKKEPLRYEIHVKAPFSIDHYKGWSKALHKIFIKIKTDQHVSLIKSPVSFLFHKEAHFDSASGFALARMIQSLLKTGVIVDTKALPSLIFEHLKDEALPVVHYSRQSYHRFLLEEIGKNTLKMMDFSLDILRFFGYAMVILWGMMRGKKRFPLISLINHIEQVGLRACPIIALISFLIGMVLAYQGIIQLSRFGAEIYTVDFLSVGVLREIGVLLTAIVIAGRSSSAFTAQIGTMQLNQEIDAMRVMQLDPVIYLVIPRVLALMISLPLLVFLSDIAAFLGGMLTMNLVISLDTAQFLHQLKSALSLHNFWVGMSKAPLFALIIAFVGCFRGMKVRNSAESVGQMTTASVVEAIFLVIVANAVMSILFSYMKV